MLAFAVVGLLSMFGGSVSVWPESGGSGGPEVLQLPSSIGGSDLSAAGDLVASADTAPAPAPAPAPGPTGPGGGGDGDAGGDEPQGPGGPPDDTNRPGDGALNPQGEDAPDPPLAPSPPEGRDDGFPGDGKVGGDGDDDGLDDHLGCEELDDDFGDTTDVDGRGKISMNDPNEDDSDD